MPPADYRPSENQAQDPHILRAIGRAWGWRRRMEAGEFATIQELGPKGFGEAVGRSWKSFLTAAEGVVDIETHAGLEAAASLFVETLQGRTDPQKGIIIQP